MKHYAGIDVSLGTLERLRCGRAGKHLKEAKVAS